MAVTIALAGNPNAGKTTLFNQLTGSNQYVGNWPGVTVEKKEGKLKGHKDIVIADLPGIYSLSPYTLEEVVARNYLINNRPNAILNIVDGTNLERNLYLSTQLKELGVPVIMAINMMDVVTKNGDVLNLEALGKAMGCKVISISALRNQGIDELISEAVAEANSGAVPAIEHRFSENVEKALSEIQSKISGEVPEALARFFAIKLFERDDKIRNELPEKAKNVDVESIISGIEKEEDDDAESIITNERYKYIQSIISSAYEKRGKTGLTTSDKIDSIVTNRFIALPLFALIMFAVYYISISTVGTKMTDWVNDVLFGSDPWSFFGLVDLPSIPGAVTSLLESMNVNEALQGLVIDGIVAGLGAVLGFLPQMLTFFLFLILFTVLLVAELRIMTRAIITITEGKTAALQDLGIADVNNGLPATGTGTDGITLITDPDAPRYTDAGTFSVLGSLLASAAYETVRECLELYDKPWNRDDSLATPPAVDLSRLRNKECGH